MRMNKTQRYCVGAFAGMVASLFHTAVMLTLHRLLPQARRRPVPPKEIASVVAEVAGAEWATPGIRLNAVTAVGHFGYGAAAGALYAPIAGRVHDKPLAAGVAYGVGIWAASYLGWIPALRILTPATEHPAQRNVMMILAHVAWGAALATVFEKVEHNKPQRQ